MADLSVTVNDTEQTYENVMFGVYDSHYNLAYSTVAVAPSPATTGTQLTLATGNGANFSPGTYNATVWPANTAPTVANAEVVRVTGKSGDILQITRTQEGSTARSIQVGDQISSSMTAKTFTDVENKLFNYQTHNSGTLANAVGRLNIQMGWLQVLGNGTNFVSGTVTFPVAYTTILGVIPNVLSYKSTGGAATDITGFDTDIGAVGWSTGAKTITTSNFLIYTERQTGTFGAGNYIAFSWIAWGL